MVRFRRATWEKDKVWTSPTENWEVGLLIEYHKWEKIATVLFNDQLLRLPARDVQKFGRRYLEDS